MDTKQIAVLLAFALNLHAEQVEITAANVFADEKALMSDLSGDVIVKKGLDELRAQRVKIYFDAQKTPMRYVALGDAKFKGILNEKNYDGKGQEVIYDPLKMLYTLKGNAYLHEIDTGKEVYGDVIEIDQQKGTYNVVSKDKKPVKLIFQIDDKR